MLWQADLGGKIQGNPVVSHTENRQARSVFQYRKFLLSLHSILLTERCFGFFYRFSSEQEVQLLQRDRASAIWVEILSTAVELYEKSNLKGLQYVNDLEVHSRSFSLPLSDKP